MSVEQYRTLLWNLAVVLGWLSPLVIAMGYYARLKFRSLLKAPLTEEVEHLTHLWERRVSRWTVLGILTPGLSIACFIGWVILARTSPGSA